MKPTSPEVRPPWTWADAIGLVSLSLLAAWFLHASWRRWPDPMVDFGRELYLPWRLSEGAVLYRDLDQLFGPLSQYFNSLVFRIGGASLDTLVAVNIALYAAIMGLLYQLLRSGWGRLAALAGTACFISVFSFSHLVGIGNYNYVTPYAHEATHGILQLLSLTAALLAALRRPTRGRLFGAGVLAGLSVLIKPEYMLASAAVTGGAVMLWGRRTRDGTQECSSGFAGLLFLAGGALPMTVACLLFSTARGVSWTQALQYANHAWLEVFSHADLVRAPAQKHLLGLDHPWPNLWNVLLHGAAGVGGAAGAALLCRMTSRGRAWAAAGPVVLVAAVSGFALTYDWLNIGLALPGLLLMAACLEARGLVRHPGLQEPVGTASRLLLVLAATFMLFRMMLSPRIYQYGFTQAALAGAVVVAVLVASVPRAFRLAAAPRRGFQVVVIALLAACAVRVARVSRSHSEANTFPVAGGSPDHFLASAPEADPSGLVLEAARRFLAQDATAHSLLVLPEGVMLNYLTRIPGSIAYYNPFVPAMMGNGRWGQALAQLRASPPDRIALFGTDLSEFDGKRFGDSKESGSEFLDFVQENYQPAPVFHYGGDPRVPDYGILIWARK